MKFVGYQSIPRIILSPSVWREWIEIDQGRMAIHRIGSPSVWREWIEMVCLPHMRHYKTVSLRVEGVD